MKSTNISRLIELEKTNKCALKCSRPNGIFLQTLLQLAQIWKRFKKCFAKAVLLKVHSNQLIFVECKIGKMFKKDVIIQFCHAHSQSFFISFICAENYRFNIFFLLSFPLHWSLRTYVMLWERIYHQKWLTRYYFQPKFPRYIMLSLCSQPILYYIWRCSLLFIKLIWLIHED